MSRTTLPIIDIEGIYAGETFSRSVDLFIDDVKQEPSLYSIAAKYYRDTVNGCTSSNEVYDATTNGNTVLIESVQTKGMLGNYILVVYFNMGGVITIRKARFKVERV